MLYLRTYLSFSFFFFNDTATTEIYTLSLHDALPILPPARGARISAPPEWMANPQAGPKAARGLAIHSDRKSTRLNSSHSQISYAVFCLKKKKKSESDGFVQYVDIVTRSTGRYAGHLI